MYGSIGIVEFLFVLASAAILVIPAWRLSSRLGYPGVVRDADSPSTGQPRSVVLHRVLILAGCEFSLADPIIGSHHRIGPHLD